MRIGVIMIHPDGYKKAFMEQATYDFITSAGIEVVPILPTIGAAEAAAYFEYIHGLYLHPGFPGDYTGLLNNLRISKLFLTMAVAANKQGDYFPIWGSCMGFQLIIRHVGVLEKMNDYDSLELHHQHLTLTGAPSRILSYATPDQYTYFTKAYQPWYNHQLGISVDRFMASSSLSSTFNVISTSHDRKGHEYIAFIEGKELPFYGVQFHPEYHQPVWWLMGFLHRELEKSKHRGFSPLPGALVHETLQTEIGPLDCMTYV